MSAENKNTVTLRPQAARMENKEMSRRAEALREYLQRPVGDADVYYRDLKRILLKGWSV